MLPLPYAAMRGFRLYAGISGIFRLQRQRYLLRRFIGYRPAPFQFLFLYFRQRK